MDFAAILDFFVVPTESGFHVSFSSVSGVECFVSFAGSSAAAPCMNKRSLEAEPGLSVKCYNIYSCLIRFDVVSTA